MYPVSLITHGEHCNITWPLSYAGSLNLVSLVLPRQPYPACKKLAVYTGKHWKNSDPLLPAKKKTQPTQNPRNGREKKPAVKKATLAS